MMFNSQTRGEGVSQARSSIPTKFLRFICLLKQDSPDHFGTKEMGSFLSSVLRGRNEKGEADKGQHNYDKQHSFHLFLLSL